MTAPIERLTSAIQGESFDSVPEDSADKMRNQILRSVYDLTNISQYLKGG